MHDSDPVVHEHVRPPGALVTVYPVIADPPSLAGADHDTVTWPFPPTPDTLSGLVGTVAPAEGVTEFEGSDAALSPTPLVATTVNVYA